MTNAENLNLLKMDLQISTNALDDLLESTMSTAMSAINREGINLVSDTDGGLVPEDAELVRTYAAYIYSKRRENVGMPRNLRWRLNNRLFSQKAKETENA